MCREILQVNGTYYTYSYDVVLCRRLLSFSHAATTEIYTLSLHDALPISIRWCWWDAAPPKTRRRRRRHKRRLLPSRASGSRSEEHTSELQSREKLVCRLLLEKKNNTR